MEQKYEPVLAMYDVRGKQDFIYSSSYIQEIAGASSIIRNVFNDYLMRAAGETAAAAGESACKGIYTYRSSQNSGEEFSRENFRNRMESGEYLGEVVYDGGGNFFILYRNRETYIRVTRRFTKSIMESIGTLRVQSTCIPEVHFDNYSKDSADLYKAHEINSAQETSCMPVNTVPVVQVHSQSGRPLTDHFPLPGGADPKVTREQFAKRTQYRKENNWKDGTLPEGNDLDSLVRKKGEDSLLAIIYIDGNSMGAKVQTVLNGKTSYEECINALRRFSDQLQKEYVDEPVARIGRALNGQNPEKANQKRIIIAAGDEMTVICEADQAMHAVKAYFDYQKELNAGNGRSADPTVWRTSCAGIAVFHAHAPFADAYRIAEECCENAKSSMKENRMANAQLIDFHYCQSGIGTSLKTIRREEGENASRPWLWESWDEKEYANIPGFRYMEEDADSLQVNQVLRYLKTMARTNIKGLRGSAMEGEGALEFDLSRIEAHRSEAHKNDITYKDLKALYPDEDQLRIIIKDLAEVYDIWFRKEGADDEGKN